MIRHVVCFLLKEPTEEILNQSKEILLSMKDRVSILRNIDVGIDCLRSERSYDIILIADFDSLEDLNEYQNHPYHCDVVKKHMHSVRKASISVDYIVSGGDDGSRLV